ncbi:MAG: tripartite tricarboxylate transporter substrate binding protein [bacterium]|nr:tripartite tricarboxylate transporter substrate binding protein [bacterium]
MVKYHLYHPKNRSMVIFVAVMMLFGLGSGIAVAEKYPSKAIEMVAWASPGGGSDRMCRAFAKAISNYLDEDIYVINKKGGGGAVGMSYLQKRPADGYTLLGVTNNLVFTPLSKPNFKYNYKNFQPIIMWGFDPKVISVCAKTPYKTIENLVAAAKKEPGKVKFGLFGTGTDDHIITVMLSQAAGVKFGFVPFDSGGEQLAAMLGGHVDAMVTEYQEVATQVEAGKVRILATATGQRLESLADVPTMKEKGWDVVVPKFRGLVVKKGVPDEVTDYLIAKALTAIQDPVFKNYLKNSMIEPYILVGGEFEKLIGKQHVKFGEILKELGFIK